MYDTTKCGYPSPMSSCQDIGTQCQNAQGSCMTVSYKGQGTANTYCVCKYNVSAKKTSATFDGDTNSQDIKDDATFSDDATFPNEEYGTTQVNLSEVSLALFDAKGKGLITNDEGDILQKIVNDMILEQGQLVSVTPAVAFFLLLQLTADGISLDRVEALYQLFAAWVATQWTPPDTVADLSKDSNELM